MNMTKAGAAAEVIDADVDEVEEKDEHEDEDEAAAAVNGGRTGKAAIRCRVQRLKRK